MIYLNPIVAESYLILTYPKPFIVFAAAAICLFIIVNVTNFLREYHGYKTRA